MDVHTCYVSGLKVYTDKKGHRIESELGADIFMLAYAIWVG